MGAPIFPVLLATASLVSRVCADLFVQRKCKGQTCNGDDHPLMDWDPEKNSCFCRPHPCHHDVNEQGARAVHRCQDPAKPFLAFSYTEDKRLQCHCYSQPALGSVHVAHELCAGQSCADGFDLLLDYDESKGGCICSKHPCTTDGPDGNIRHNCGDPAFPLLKYHFEEDGTLTCACVAAYAQKQLDEL